ncbi:hypothetical protein O3M35_012643 [Rhynocoris fuscipes]|uniref:Coiled-coil-helix-coiled-coil-helix domain-containing protein 7 n=1 Tax=Rhynocoris fuscipes TaxID=488301 RepID=A0AAW1CU90_9HEMI
MDKNAQRLASHDTNPCLKEHNSSLKCLARNNYDPESCEKHFSNYKACKSFWNEVKRQRRLHGIRPLLPPPEEREAIKIKFFESGKIM